MRRVTRSALVPYSAGQMFALVDGVEHYPEFVPWCTDTVVHHRDAETVEATLELSRGGIRQRFRTRNRFAPGEFMTISLVDGPFRRMEGRWTFVPLGEGGCKVSLDIEFELSSRALDLVLGRFFEDTCNALVDAFTERAQSVYGKAD